PYRSIPLILPGAKVTKDIPVGSYLRFDPLSRRTNTPPNVGGRLGDPFMLSKQQVIGYGGCVEWPPRSPDLNPLGFFLWGYIKQRVYATRPPTMQELRNRITDACASVSRAMLYNVQWEAQSRVHMCIAAEGHNFEHDR
ncbi:hypothetical protein AVEN_12353-1, partial [Araneus ventricosus]